MRSTFEIAYGLDGGTIATGLTSWEAVARGWGGFADLYVRDERGIRRELNAEERREIETADAWERMASGEPDWLRERDRRMVR